MLASTFVQSENVVFGIYFKQRSCIASIERCSHSYRLINRFKVHSVAVCVCTNDFSGSALVLQA